MDRQDLVTAPNDPYFQENGYDAIIPLDARRGMYQYIFYGKASVAHVLDEVRVKCVFVDRSLTLSKWLGDMSLDSLKLMLMRQKIAAAGMEVSDFSRMARPMVRCFVLLSTALNDFRFLFLVIDGARTEMSCKC